MSFTSISFILFVSAAFLLYFLIPKRIRWMVLLVASCVYYWLSSEWLIFYMIGASAITFLGGWGIEAIAERGRRATEGKEISAQEKKIIRKRIKGQKRTLLTVCVLMVLGLLIYLKYHNFLMDGLQHFLPSVQLPRHDLLQPIGISFYTLQAIAYLTDIHRGKIKPDRNPFKFLLYMSYFPQILQGPIPRYSQLAEQLYTGHEFNYDRMLRGLLLVLWGMFKKSVIADHLAGTVAGLFSGFNLYTGLINLVAALLYSIQIYMDFSGGMDIACGISEVFGIQLTQNFRQPYFSRSIEEFWRRWHITLGGWMRDYVFYPLSLSKLFLNIGKRTKRLFGPDIGKKIPPFLAMFVVYFFVGLWHGPRIQYIVYGVWNGFFIMTGILLEDGYRRVREKLRIQDESRVWRGFQMLRTFLICTIGRFFARGEGLWAALGMIRTFIRQPADTYFLRNGILLSFGLVQGKWIVILIAVFLVLAIDILHEKDKSVRDWLMGHRLCLWLAFYLMILSVFLLGSGLEYDTSNFIYAQF